MRTIEARAVISARDATGMVFSAIAQKISRLTATARNANTAAAGAARRAGAVEAAAAGAGRATGRASAAASVSAGRAAAAAAAAARFGAAGVGAGLGMAGIGGLATAAGGVYLGQKSVRRYAETDMAITRIGITADATDAEIQQLNRSISGLSSQTGKSFDDVTSGLESLVAGGMDLPQALPALPAIAKTAQAAGAEVKDMATTALALNQALGISTSKMDAAFDTLVVGGKAGKFELKDMARYMASMAPQAAAIGLKGEEGLKRIVAVLQTIRAGSGTTEEAASSFSDLLGKMETDETANKFKKFGIDIRKEMDKSRKSGKDLIQTFVEMTEKALKGDLSKLPLLAGDKEMRRAVLALLSYKNVLDDVTNRLKTSGGAGATDLERALDRPQVALDKLSATLDVVLQKLGSKLWANGGSAVVGGANRILREIIEEDEKPEVQKAREALARRRRAPLERERREIDQKIDVIEKAGDSKNPTWRERMRGHPGADREKILGELRLRKFEIDGALSAQTPEEMGPIFSEKELEVLQEVDRERRRGQALSDMGKNKTGKRVTATGKMGWKTPAPNDGRAGENNILDLPSKSVTAELTGSAEVSGETTVKVEVEVKPSSELLNAIATAKNTTAQMRGQLNTNGPGSTGKSSPDAAAPAPPISY
ncbi:phage tail tape measure protein [Rhodopseudomonas sp. HC1]|uniref:phage tail tape measure protein n=1 Tax=Rhodopseudomonas infernalis TaxID=2897386 RepID=UPI001EE789E0|nr:phage tail tape measure protein [Rhodopseudomonas infernalis]MCG6204200.1 phage tail tape measure protein [Rhodopseudomonas infernalis]